MNFLKREYSFDCLLSGSGTPSLYLRNIDFRAAERQLVITLGGSCDYIFVPGGERISLGESGRSRYEDTLLVQFNEQYHVEWTATRAAVKEWQAGVNAQQQCRAEIAATEVKQTGELYSCPTPASVPGKVGDHGGNTPMEWQVSCWPIRARVSFRTREGSCIEHGISELPRHRHNGRKLLVLG